MIDLFSVLPLTKQLSCLSGCLWSRAIQGQRAQRIEMLLLHKFHDCKFILPDKISLMVRKVRSFGKRAIHYIVSELLTLHDAFTLLCKCTGSCEFSGLMLYMSISAAEYFWLFSF